MSDANKAIGEKILAISESIGAVKQDGKNTFSDYNFVSSEQMLFILRKELPKHHLAIIPSITSAKEEISQTEKGKQVIRTTVYMTFELIDTETGNSIEKTWIGADQDFGGKSFGQAVTEATKRFYFKLFNVSSQGDADPDSKTTEATSIPSAETLINRMTEAPSLDILKKSYQQIYKYRLNFTDTAWAKVDKAKDQRKKELT